MIYSYHFQTLGSAKMGHQFATRLQSLRTRLIEDSTRLSAYLFDHSLQQPHVVKVGDDEGRQHRPQLVLDDGGLGRSHV